MASYRDLIIWQKAYTLALETYRATSRFPSREVFGLTSQLRRATVSIPLNIAEGHCRHSRLEYLQFLSVARGSAAEVSTLLSLARDLSYLEAEAAERLTGLADSVGMMLTRLAQSLRTSSGRSRSPKPKV